MKCEEIDVSFSCSKSDNVRLKIILISINGFNIF